MSNGIIVRVDPIIDYSVRGLCVRPYYNHPKGCPNFNKKEGCPPQVGYYDKIFNLSKPIYAIINEFDFKSHVNKMKDKHPEWSDRQLRCCLYWQRTARNQLAEHIKQFTKEYGNDFTINTCPEAMGVNIIKTLESVGIKLEFPPIDMVRHVALAGILLK